MDRRLEIVLMMDFLKRLKAFQFTRNKLMYWITHGLL